MKAEVTDNGLLVLTAETMRESRDLQGWIQDRDVLLREDFKALRPTKEKMDICIVLRKSPIICISYLRHETFGWRPQRKVLNACVWYHWWRFLLTIGHRERVV